MARTPRSPAPRPLVPLLAEARRLGVADAGGPGPPAGHALTTFEVRLSAPSTFGAPEAPGRIRT